MHFLWVRINLHLSQFVLYWECPKGQGNSPATWTTFFDKWIRIAQPTALTGVYLSATLDPNRFFRINSLFIEQLFFDKYISEPVHDKSDSFTVRHWLWSKYWCNAFPFPWCKQGNQCKRLIKRSLARWILFGESYRGGVDTLPKEGRKVAQSSRTSGIYIGIVGYVGRSRHCWAAGRNLYPKCIHRDILSIVTLWVTLRIYHRCILKVAHRPH